MKWFLSLHTQFCKITVFKVESLLMHFKPSKAEALASFGEVFKVLIHSHADDSSCWVSEFQLRNKCQEPLSSFLLYRRFWETESSTRPEVSAVTSCRGPRPSPFPLQTTVKLCCYAWLQNLLTDLECRESFSWCPSASQDDGNECGQDSLVDNGLIKVKGFWGLIPNVHI